MARPCVLLKYGELMLKGRNRNRFEKRLHEALQHAMDGASAPVRISQRTGVVVVSGAPLSELVERAHRVIGINVVQPAWSTGHSVDDTVATVSQALRERYGSPEQAGARRFAVRPDVGTRTSRWGRTSSRRSSALVVEEWGWPVDLTNPRWRSPSRSITARWSSLEKQRGQGGLPVGSSGRALVLLSGGYDSPVAAYRAMRRGLRCDFVHFTGAPLTGPSSTYKARWCANSTGSRVIRDCT